MAGVGKTELAKHVNNELLRTPSPFHYVYWVTVSPDFSIHKLQDTIARMVNLDLSSVDDKHIRAARLFEVLKDKNFVLILDDMWNYLPLEMVGIPDNMKRCKLVLTTRSLNVCRKMDCQKNIKVKPLSLKASRELFFQELGYQIVPSLEKIAESIVLECDGLPLGIKVMARNMKQVDDIHEWRLAGNQRKDAIEFLIAGNRREDVNEFLIAGDRREYVIGFLIDVGVLEGKSRREEFNEGHTMLNKLLNLCLLEEEEYTCSVTMHNLLKNMAIQIMNADARVIVRNDEKLSEMPEWGNWSKDLARISLMKMIYVFGSVWHKNRGVATRDITKAFQLRFLRLGFSFTVEGKEVASLRKLEELECRFHSVVKLVYYGPSTRISRLRKPLSTASKRNRRSLSRTTMDRKLFVCSHWKCHKTVGSRKEVLSPVKLGSVNAANCKELVAKLDVGGFLVGGASLKSFKVEELLKAAIRELFDQGEQPQEKETLSSDDLKAKIKDYLRERRCLIFLDDEAWEDIQGP
ncbi:hypothetical protein GH714_010930 [Hevea brasiliensis]|uniref:NB-ARC domain-containing protein n=1 Tax=Hevea brasiliensis TaxID=3981 RepID=A0A6A6N1T8_HEVBR|nr:hypothetical protein GH714_010930 [Hevea brasiliensis]